MDDKIRPNNLYMSRKDNNHLDENIRNFDDAVNDNPQWRKDATTGELMSMGTTNVHDAGDHNLNRIKEQGLKFYVE
jgi:hypothetical protein